MVQAHTQATYFTHKDKKTHREDNVYTHKVNMAYPLRIFCSNCNGAYWTHLMQLNESCPILIIDELTKCVYIVATVVYWVVILHYKYYLKVTYLSYCRSSVIVHFHFSKIFSCKIFVILGWRYSDSCLKRNGGKSLSFHSAKLNRRYSPLVSGST